MVDTTDYRMQPSFPIASVIDAAQRNTALQYQARQAGQQSLIEGLQGIGQIGQGLVNRRRAMAQALTMGQSLGMSPDEVQGLMPDEVEKLGQIKQGQVQMGALMLSLHPEMANDPTFMTRFGMSLPKAQPAQAPEIPGNAPSAPAAKSASQTQSVSSGAIQTQAQPPPPPPPVMPIQMPPLNKTTANLMTRIGLATRQVPVVTQSQALDKGSVTKGTQIVKPTAMDQISWDTASPQQQNLAKALHEGRIRPLDVGFRDRGPITLLANEYGLMRGAPFRGYVGETNAAMAKYSTSGKMGQNALALNTALGHAASAYDSYQKVGNTNQAWLNTPLNKLRTATNDPNVVALGINLNALQGELANVFKSSGATDQEISKWHDYLNENLTPAQVNGALPKIDELLKSRLDAMEYQRSAAGGGTGAPLISPHAQEISQKFSGGTPDDQAIAWVKDHPNDPRVPAVLKKAHAAQGNSSGL